VTGHIKHNDRIMYGWPDIVDQLRRQGHPVTLEAFFAHVRHTLFHSRETRKVAYDELLALPDELSAIADCAALAIRLKLIWKRMYPAASAELKPVPPLRACLLIHKMLITASRCTWKQRQASLLLAAWADFEFPYTRVYKQHLLKELHVDVNQSMTQCKSYLNDVYSMLNDAHNVYVNVVRDTQDPSSSGTHSAFAMQPPKLSRHAGPAKRGRSASRDTGKPGGSRASSKGGTAKAAAAKPEFKGLTEAGEARERALPSGLRFSDIAAAANLKLSLDECIARGRANKCVLCEEPRGHLGGLENCPAVPANCRDAVSNIVKKRAARRKAETKSNKKARKSAAK
jgi:hypothetical protein